MAGAPGVISKRHVNYLAFFITVKNYFSFYLAIVNAAVRISDFLIICQAIYFMLGDIVVRSILFCDHSIHIYTYIFSLFPVISSFRICSFSYCSVYGSRVVYCRYIFSRGQNLKIYSNDKKNYRMYYLILSRKPSKRC